MARDERSWYEVLIIALLYLAILVFLACGVMPVVFQQNVATPATEKVDVNVKYD